MVAVTWYYALLYLSSRHYHLRICLGDDGNAVEIDLYDEADLEDPESHAVITCHSLDESQLVRGPSQVQLVVNRSGDLGQKSVSTKPIERKQSAQELVSLHPSSQGNLGRKRSARGTPNLRSRQLKTGTSDHRPGGPYRNDSIINMISGKPAGYFIFGWSLQITHTFKHSTVSMTTNLRLPEVL